MQLVCIEMMIIIKRMLIVSLYDVRTGVHVIIKINNGEC